MMRAFASFAVAFLLPVAALAAPVEEEPTNLPITQGFYGELNVGSNSASVTVLDVKLKAYKGVGTNANIGYQMSPYVALEAGYSRYFDGIGAFSGALKGIIPWGHQGRNKVFVKSGLAYFTAAGERVRLIYGGIGYGYSVRQNWEIVAQFQGQTIGIATIGISSLGVAYHY